MPIILFLSKAWAILFLAVILTAGCGQQNEERHPDTDKDTQQENVEKPETPASLPPNSARVSGVIQNLQPSKDDPVKISFQVKKIEGYGSSTRPLSENQQLELTSSSRFLKKRGISLRTGDSLTIVISQTMTLGDESKSAWRIVDFE